MVNSPSTASTTKKTPRLKNGEQKDAPLALLPLPDRLFSKRRNGSSHFSPNFDLLDLLTIRRTLYN